MHAQGQEAEKREGKKEARKKGYREKKRCVCNVSTFPRMPTFVVAGQLQCANDIVAGSKKAGTSRDRLVGVMFLFDGCHRKAEPVFVFFAPAADLMWGRPQQQAICLLTLPGAPFWLDDRSRPGLCALHFTQRPLHTIPTSATALSQEPSGRLTDSCRHNSTFTTPLIPRLIYLPIGSFLVVPLRRISLCFYTIVSSCAANNWFVE